MKSILEETKIYVCACQQARLERLPKKLARLNLPYIIERELPSPLENPGRGDVLLDACSRRFRDTCIKDVDKPLLWLEDDIDIPYNFREIWSYYESTLPSDWQVAVIGWGLIPSFAKTKIRCMSPGWWSLVGCPPRFCGTQAVLINRGGWRLKLEGQRFRCDIHLHEMLKEIGITGIYNTDRILIGTNDVQTTFGAPIIQHKKLIVPRYHMYLPNTNKPTPKTVPITDKDFVGDIIPITTFTYIPPLITQWMKKLMKK